MQPRQDQRPHTDSLDLYFVPGVTNSLIRLLSHLKTLLKTHVDSLASVGVTRSHDQKWMLVQFERLLGKLSKQALHLILPCYPTKQKNTKARAFEIYGLRKFLGVIRGDLAERRRSLSLNMVNQPSEKQWQDLKLLPRFLKKVKRLELHSCKFDSGEWYWGFHSISELTLEHSPLSWKGAQAIAGGLPLLLKLKFHVVIGLTDESVILIAKSHPRLEQLDITAGEIPLTVQIIKPIVTNCRQLKALTISLSTKTPANEEDIMALVCMSGAAGVRIPFALTSIFRKTLQVFLLQRNTFVLINQQGGCSYL